MKTMSSQSFVVGYLASLGFVARAFPGDREHVLALGDGAAVVALLADCGSVHISHSGGFFTLKVLDVQVAIATRAVDYHAESDIRLARALTHAN